MKNDRGPMGIFEGYGDFDEVDSPSNNIECEATALAILDKIMNRYASNVLFHDSALAQQAWDCLNRASPTTS